MPHIKFKEPYSDVLKPYSDVLELDLPKIEFHALFFFLFFLFFFFLSLIRHNSILIKSSFETGARPYIVWKQGHIPNFFKKRGKMPDSPYVSMPNDFSNVFIFRIIIIIIINLGLRRFH